MNKLLTCCKALWELVIDVALFYRKAILMYVLNPGLKLGVLNNVVIRLVVQGEDFLDECRDGFPQTKSVIPKQNKFTFSFKERTSLPRLIFGNSLQMSPR